MGHLFGFKKIAVVIGWQMMVGCSDPAKVNPNKEPSDPGQAAMLGTDISSKGDPIAAGPTPIGGGTKGSDPIAAEPTPISGANLIVTVEDANVDPSTVQGYIVGNPSQFKAEPLAAGQGGSERTYIIRNVPEGDHDVIMTAGSVGRTGAPGTASDLGIRLSKVKVNKGETRRIERLRIPKMGHLEGVVQLQGKQNHELVMIAFPGTNIPVGISDAGGRYSLKNIPVGTHEITFSHNGYITGRIANQLVESEQTITVPEMVLYPSLGAKGTLTLGDGSGVSTSRTIKVNITPTGDVTLMALSDQPMFANIPWVPFASYTTYTFKEDGMNKNLFLKLSDSNGLISEFSAQVAVMIFGDVNLIVKRSASQTKVALALKATNASQMYITNTVGCGTGGVWENYQPNKEWTPVNSVNAKNTVFVKFRNTAGDESICTSGTIEARE